jgi:tetratricopeptide (TPR) repeat protein
MLAILSMLTLFPLLRAYAFQTETPAAAGDAQQLTYFELLEAGLTSDKNSPLAFRELAAGRYPQALQAMKTAPGFSSPWLASYLEGLVRVSSPLEKHDSEHFELWTPPGQSFLADYALPVLEENARHLDDIFGYRPAARIRVEIYPNKEDFSAASTLSVETLERSGAIGICKFHRLMIVSPRALPLGYRWLDALCHEYTHLIINELSHTKAELWLHEGTARYFETSYRSTPPLFLTPDQKTKLKEAVEKKTLVPFARMSPSMVYLKDQDEVTLAFAEVSYAVSRLVQETSPHFYADFLRDLSRMPFAQAFERRFRKSPSVFERQLKDQLAAEPWEKTRGTMSDNVSFKPLDETDVTGADAEGQVRLGDRMRMQGLNEAALIQYNRALAQEPDNALVLLKAARTYLLLNNKPKAIEALRRATDKNPNYITPHVELAALVEPDEALKHLNEAIAINPFDPRIHDMLRQIYAARGEKEKADREAAALLSLRP